MEKNNVFYRGDLNRIYPVMEKAEGIYIYDSNGNKYLDAQSGIGVMNLGYGVREIIDAMADQAGKLPFCYTILYTSQAQEDLAKMIAALAPPGLNKVWFSLAGAEANECAMKAARQYHVETGNPSKYKIISRWQSYHGSTLATLSVTGNQVWRKNFAPMLFDYPKIAPANCYRCPFGKNYPGCDLDCAYDLERVINFLGNQEVAAFIAEPVVAGSAGVTAPPAEYFPIIRSICDKYNVLLILDEVFCGNGRTGKYFAIEHWKITPDIISIAKGIAGGYIPLGATIIHEKIYDAIHRGSGQFVHGLTFGGHPVACAAGLAALNYMEKHALVARAAEMGNYLMGKLSSLSDCWMVGQVRGKGLLIGIEFVADQNSKEPFEPALGVAKKIVAAAFKRGLLVQMGTGTADGVRGDHILICPPFTISKSEADRIVEILREVIKGIQENIKSSIE